MSQTPSNRRRVFADLVSIDAWHDNFADGRSMVDLHADVVFGTARVGGEKDSPVRFRLSMRRAEVVVVLPELEPASVDRKSVSRDAPEAAGNLIEILEQSNKGAAWASATISGSRSGVKGAASVGGDVESSRSSTKRVQLSSSVNLMLVTQSQTAEGHYRWIIEPTTSGILYGRPWDARTQPRLKVIDERKDRSKGLPPTVRIEVHCRREDLEITHLEIKDESLWQNAKRRVGFRNRLAAAESYIRDQLLKEGLEVRNITDSFGHLTLAAVTAQPS